MKDEPLKTCPKCGGKIRRLINGGGGVIFKGSGFYATDKKKENGKNEGAAPCAACPAAKSGECPSAANAEKASA